MEFILSLSHWDRNVHLSSQPTDTKMYPSFIGACQTVHRLTKHPVYNLVGFTMRFLKGTTFKFRIEFVFWFEEEKIIRKKKEKKIEM